MREGHGLVTINGTAYQFTEGDTVDLGTIPDIGLLQLEFNPSFVTINNDVRTDMDVDFDYIPEYYNEKGGVYSFVCKYQYIGENPDSEVYFGIDDSEGNDTEIVRLHYIIKFNQL